MLNPCLAGLPPRLAEHELVRAAWEGIDATLVWDGHAHLAGIGDSGDGVWINPDSESLAHPLQFGQRLFFLNAGCANGAPGQVDRSYVERMRSLLDPMPPGAKLVLLAFDQVYTESGDLALSRSSFYVPNAYAHAVAQRHPDRFEWAASIHPYRRDCVVALESAAGQGARAVKWLPAAMGIDPGSALCDGFYSALARLDLPLITHAGLERAVLGSDTQEYGNPLRLRRALDHGVRVVMAHCASMGQDRDLDRGPNGPMVDSFELFERMMEVPRFVGKLFGDLSALPQYARAPQALGRRDRADRLAVASPQRFRLPAARRNAALLARLLRRAGLHRSRDGAGVERNTPVQSTAVRFRSEAAPGRGGQALRCVGVRNAAVLQSHSLNQRLLTPARAHPGQGGAAVVRGRRGGPERAD